MDAPWRSDTIPQIDTALWEPIGVQAEGAGEGEKRSWLVKSACSRRSNDGIHVLVTDLCRVWGEKVEGADVSERSKELNPNVEAPPVVIVCHLATCLLPNNVAASPPTLALDPSADTVTLSLSTTLSGLPFLWEFHCTREDPKELSSHLVTPLLLMAAELSRRQQELMKLLRSKDKEIQDYKDGGAQVSRKHLETVPFQESAFSDAMVRLQEIEATAVSPLKALDDPFCQELYRDVIGMRHLTQTRNDLSSFNSESAVVPPTLLTTSSPLSSPTKSPLRIPPPAAASPSKDEERNRREALEKKLEEEKRKPGKKRRKLM